MCNACMNSCCGSDELTRCGCNYCEEPACWDDDECLLDEAGAPDLGLCCKCGQEAATVIVMVSFKTPGGNGGWGCIACGLPEEGAVTVLCAECGQIDAGDRFWETPVICLGYPRDNLRYTLTRDQQIPHECHH